MAEVEVYESSDLPEDDQHIPAPPQPERFESEHIEAVQLDVGAALQRFKGKTLSNEDADFSDSSSGRNVRGFRGGGDAFVLELMGGRQEGETLHQRYNRLRQEVLELGKDVQAIKDAKGQAKGKEEAISAVDVAGLQGELGRLEVEWVTKEAAAAAGADPSLSAKLVHSVESLRAAAPKEAKGGKAKEGGGGGVTYELAVEPRSVAAAKAAGLEARLARLEKALGSEGAGGDKSGRGLRGSVEWLERRVGLLEPGALEAAEARMASVLTKLTAASEKSEGGAEETELVRELWEKVSKWDEVGAALPDVVARLHALQELHLQALHLAQSLSQAEAAQRELGKSLAADHQLLADTKDSVAASLATFQALSDSIHKSLK